MCDKSCFEIKFIVCFEFNASFCFINKRKMLTIFKTSERWRRLYDWLLFHYRWSRCGVVSGACDIIEALDRARPRCWHFCLHAFVRSANALLKRFKWIRVLHLRQFARETAKQWRRLLSCCFHNGFSFVVTADKNLSYMYKNLDGTNTCKTPNCY
jgi:hypothetical protein